MGEKNDILDDFASKVGNVELEIESSCKCIESIVELV